MTECCSRIVTPKPGAGWARRRCPRCPRCPMRMLLTSFVLAVIVTAATADDRVTLDVAGEPLADVAATLSSEVSCALFFSKRIGSEKVTLKLADAPIRSVVGEICTQLNLESRDLGRGRFALTRCWKQALDRRLERPIYIRLSDVSPQDVLTMLSTVHRFPVVIDPVLTDPWGGSPPHFEEIESDALKGEDLLALSAGLAKGNVYRLWGGIVIASEKRYEILRSRRPSLTSDDGWPYLLEEVELYVERRRHPLSLDKALKSVIGDARLSWAKEIEERVAALSVREGFYVSTRENALSMLLFPHDLQFEVSPKGIRVFRGKE